MTFVGHSLAGASIAIIAMNPKWSIEKKLLLSFSFVLLGNFPDLKFPHWGHDRYDISHSIFSNLFLISLTSLILYFQNRYVVKWKIILFAFLAWLSHLLLDTFYNHGYGLKMFWPFSDASLSLAMPWFETIKDSRFSPESIKIYSIELLFFGSIFMLFLLIKSYISKRGNESSI